MDSEGSVTDDDDNGDPVRAAMVKEWGAVIQILSNCSPSRPLATIPTEKAQARSSDRWLLEEEIVVHNRKRKREEASSEIDQMQNKR